ncbi:RES domain-containing protein [Aeromonas enteropelogenes]|uniref:RES domain-containing protein n=1 Tax=Aeromonas enteropelogenes TaxID=29489 RepID=UPI000ADDF0C5|nr:RES domain-containing protein [Aeromonas enteropelogenes]UBH52339.1 RES domain-containing protein [Aeromonas enteropelogenes]
MKIENQECKNINFEKFDDKIGINGYHELIRNCFFPNSTKNSFDISGFSAEEFIYRKGTIFSRVRKISHDDAIKFHCGDIEINDFYPPKPTKVNVPIGRFNKKNKPVLYVADNPEIAIKECDVIDGDYYLLTFLKLRKDMCFLKIGQHDTDYRSQIIFNLLSTKDKKFYPLINLIYSDFLCFEKHHGIAYDSTKVTELRADGNISNIESTLNIAIKNEYFVDVGLDTSLLAYMHNGQARYHSIFTPLSNKKRNKIKCINYLGNKKSFIDNFMQTEVRMHNEKYKNKLLLEKGNFQKFDETPIKLTVKNN